jgi:hypothetical protein
MLRRMIIFALLMAAAPATACDLSTVTSDRAAHDAFARRAVEIITLAAAGETANEGRLDKLIDPSAAFALGSGDVGLPLGKGVAGAIAMAKRMDADQYRFLGWDYMVGPANGCGKGEIEVEFLDSPQGRVSQVKFSFENGRVVAAQGWQRSYQTGPVAKPIGR